MERFADILYFIDAGPYLAGRPLRVVFPKAIFPLVDRFLLDHNYQYENIIPGSVTLPTRRPTLDDDDNCQCIRHEVE